MSLKVKWCVRQLTHTNIALKGFTVIQFCYSLERKSGLVWTFEVPKRLLPRCLIFQVPRRLLRPCHAVEVGKTGHWLRVNLTRSVHGCST